MTNAFLENNSGIGNPSAAPSCPCPLASDPCFTEIDGQDVKDCFPRFYDQRGQFFEIVHKYKPIGFVGIRPLDQTSLCLKDCELEAFIFKQYRNALTKGIVLAVLDLPEAMGFKRCWMKTTRKTVVKVLSSMEKYGIIHAGLLNHKHVFVREFE